MSYSTPPWCKKVHAGQAYYSVLGAELRSRGYPTRSVFNWRTPLHLELIAHLPDTEWARALPLLGAGCAIGLNFAAMRRGKRYGLAFVQLLFLCIPLAITAKPITFLFAEVWSGVSIAIWVGCYAMGWHRAGASAGLLALYLPLAVLGLVGWPSPAAFRVTATVGVCLLAFSVMGVPSMSFYWGGIYSPLLALGATWAIPACRDIVRASLSPPER